MLCLVEIAKAKTMTLMPNTEKKFEFTEPTFPHFTAPLENLSANPGDAVMRYAKERDDVMFLAQGQSDIPTPDFIMDAAIEAMRGGKTFYGAPLGQDALREAISRYYKNIYGLQIPASRAFVTPSGTSAMHIALSMILSPGDHVVALTPIWKNFLGAVELTGAKTTQVSLDLKEGEWSLDLNALFDAVTEDTKALIVVTPSNPTGWFASAEEIEAIMKFARERGIWVLSDEVYSRMAYGRTRAPSFLDVAQEDDPLLVLNSFSKNWSMTGWRLGWIVAPQVADEKIYSANLYNNLCTSTFSQYGAVAALDEGEGFLADHIKLWEKNREKVVQRLGQHENVEIIYPKSTYYAMFRIKGEEDCLALSRKLIEEAAIALAPGCAFGEASRGYVRLCFAVSETTLDEALDRIEKVVTG